MAELETLAQILLRFTDINLLNDRKALTLPKSNAVEIQDRIGDKCQPSDKCVTLFVLAPGHNIIVFDTRYNRKKAYFIPTSISNYSKKGEK